MTDEQIVRDALFTASRNGCRLESTIPALDRLVARAETAEAERDTLMQASWRAYVVSGADPDGCEEWHCTPDMAGRSLMEAVEQLRSDYNEAGDEARAAEERADRLAAALERIAHFGPSWADSTPRSGIEHLRRIARAALAGEDA